MPERLRGDCLDSGQRVADTVMQLADQKHLQLFGALLWRDVARHLGGADNAPGLVAHRRDGERNVQAAATLGDADGFEVFDPLSRPQAANDLRFLTE